MQNITTIELNVDKESNYLQFSSNFIPRLKKHIKPMWKYWSKKLTAMFYIPFIFAVMFPFRNVENSQ